MFATLLAGAFAALWLALYRAPDVPIARLLHRWLVEWPAARLLNVERRHLIFIFVAIVSAQALLSVGLPDVGLVVAWDVSTYVDILLVTWSLAAVANVKAGGRLLVERWRLLTRAPTRAKPQPRAKRPACRTTIKPSANDDDRPALAA